MVGGAPGVRSPPQVLVHGHSDGSAKPAVARAGNAAVCHSSRFTVTTQSDSFLGAKHVGVRAISRNMLFNCATQLSWRPAPLHHS